MKNEKQNTQCLVTGQFYDPEIEFAKIMNDPDTIAMFERLAAQGKLEEAKECFLDLTEMAFELVLAEQQRGKEKPE